MAWMYWANMGTIISLPSLYGAVRVRPGTSILSFRLTVWVGWPAALAEAVKPGTEESLKSISPDGSFRHLPAGIFLHGLALVSSRHEALARSWFVEFFRLSQEALVSLTQNCPFLIWGWVQTQQLAAITVWGMANKTSAAKAAISQTRGLRSTVNMVLVFKVGLG